MTVVYLGGFGRSGSTLVERVLGACPGWANVGELVDVARSVAPRDERCGCGERFSQCPVWQRVGELALGGWSPAVVDDLARAQRAAARQRHLPGLLARTATGRPTDAATRRLADSFAAVHRAFATVTGADVVVDASKGPAFGLALASHPDLDVRVINLVRDPRAVAWSWAQRVQRPHATGPADEMWRVSTRRAAAQWTALQLEMEGIRRLGRVPTALLRYEDLVADPVGALSAATADLGLGLRRSDLTHVEPGEVVLGPSHGLSGNPSRFHHGPTRLTSDDRWSRRMSRADQLTATALTLPLLRAYGYPLGAGTSAPYAHRTPERSAR